MQTIQVLKPFFRVEETLQHVRECLEKGWTGMGFKTDQIEQAWKEYSGFTNAHFLNSATSGLHLALNVLKKHYGWSDGDEVITTSLTFVSTNHAILYERLAPVFADIDESSLCLSAETISKAITKKTRAVIFVGIGGNAAGYKEVRQLCKDRGLLLILDAAHMAGSKWAKTSEHVGLDADCAVFSFQAVKNCPSGDAGMICFNDPKFDKAARQSSWLGIDKSTYNRYSESSYKWRYDVNELGFKYHGNSVMASLCLVSLKYLDEDNECRRKLAEHYDLRLRTNEKVVRVVHDPEIKSSRHLYQIIVNDRDDLIDRLAGIGVYCGVHYASNERYLPYHDVKDLGKNARELSEKLVSLPLHLGIEVADIDRICLEINR